MASANPETEKTKKRKAPIVTAAGFMSIEKMPLDLVNFDLTHILNYIDVLDQAHGSTDYNYRYLYFLFLS